MPSHSQTWPVAPRPFDDETFGSWLGRLAGRYRIGVDDLVSAAGIARDVDLEVCSWLDTPAPSAHAAERLETLCRLAPGALTNLLPAVRSGRATLSYCYQCLIMNPLDLTAPYWKVGWLNADGPVCSEHSTRAYWITSCAMQRHRNMRQLFRYICHSRSRPRPISANNSRWRPH